MLKYCNINLYVSEIYPTSRELIAYLDDREEVKYEQKYYEHKLVDKPEYALQFDTREEAREEASRLEGCFDTEEYSGPFGYDLVRTHFKCAIHSIDIE